ncbi:MAG: dTDP-4-amino-4,6-dideoxygalactose transaminase [Ilumatobacteraceae bacterium]
MNSVPFNKADIREVDREYIRQAIDGGHTAGNGPFSKKVEDQIALEIGCIRTLLTTSCSHALEMAALLLRLEPGDEVIVPAFTFVTSASAFMLHGARPVFVDVRSDTLNIDPDQVAAAITSRTRAICVVHYGGVGAEMELLIALATKHGLIIVEDNAHGLFGKYQSRYLGTFGALATQSFHETKNITCGEGGALVINDELLVERAEILREKGTDRSKFLRGQVDKYTWVDVGSSWVLSDILAAILFGQLERRREIYRTRMAIYDRYDRELASWASAIGVRTPIVPSGCEHTAHVYHLRFERGDQRNRFIAQLADRGVNAVFHYQPLHLSTVGQQLGGKPGQCPVTEHAGDCLVRLPLFSSMIPEQQTQVIEAVTSFIP